MGRDKVRHVIERAGRFFWQPSKTIASLGLCAEALGTDREVAYRRAMDLNRLADEARIVGRTTTNGPLPGTLSLLFRDFQRSEEFADLKPRTQADYRYYLSKIEADLGTAKVAAITPKHVKDYYKAQRRKKSVTWAYHILGTFRVVLSWAIGEEWIETNPALDVKMKAPPKRLVLWKPEQFPVYLATAKEMGWPSLVAMAYVFDSIGQSPVDVRTLRAGSYDGRCIDVSRSKTGVEGPPIPLFPEAVVALDAYLATQPTKLPEAPLFTNDRIGGEWNRFTLNKVHARIRKAAGLPNELQLQDFRTMAATEGGAAGGSVDQLRGLQRHRTRSAGEHYVVITDDTVEQIQAMRLAFRRAKK